MWSRLWLAYAAYCTDNDNENDNEDDDDDDDKGIEDGKDEVTIHGFYDPSHVSTTHVMCTVYKNLSISTFT